MQRDLPHIVLVGPMGVGKTSVGRELAGLLDRPFFDSDAEIESEEGKTSGAIASDLGVAALHAMELQVFSDLARRQTASVIAPASSVVDSDQGRELLARCDTVRLMAAREETMRRMRMGAHRRSIGDAQAAALESRRAPHLEAVALLTLDTTNISIAEAARRIVTRLGAMGRWTGRSGAPPGLS